MNHALDNPVWASLNSAHASLARRTTSAARYPADVAPFVAVAPGVAHAAEELATLVDVGEAVLFVGPSPPLDTKWSAIEPLVYIAQMTCATRLPVGAGP